MEPGFTEHLLCPRSCVQSRWGWRHNQALRGHSQREHLREQPFCLLLLQLQLLSAFLDQVLQVLGILLQHPQHRVSNTGLLALIDAFELKSRMKIPVPQWRSAHLAHRWDSGSQECTRYSPCLEEVDWWWENVIDKGWWLWQGAQMTRRKNGLFLCEAGRQAGRKLFKGTHVQHSITTDKHKPYCTGSHNNTGTGIGMLCSS